MLAKITPLIRLPSSADTFDYHVPDEFRDNIKIGQLVSVPWRTKKVTGVVLSLDKKLGFRIAKKDSESLHKQFRPRPITDIIDKQPILTSAQLALIDKFADYYCVTAGAAARLVVPDVPKGKTRP